MPWTADMLIRGMLDKPKNPEVELGMNHTIIDPNSLPLIVTNLHGLNI